MSVLSRYHPLRPSVPRRHRNESIVLDPIYLSVQGENYIRDNVIVKYDLSRNSGFKAPVL
jgi:hypothetical protein